jgi:hypothetical protein
MLEMFKPKKKAREQEAVEEADHQA